MNSLTPVILIAVAGALFTAIAISIVKDQFPAQATIRTTQATLKVVPANPNSTNQSSSTDGLYLQGVK